MSLTGQHDPSGAEGLPPAALDAAHRIVTDATRLTKTWIDGLASDGVSEAQYVELLSVVVAVRSIDSFHRALGLALERLPDAISGEPSRRLPEGLVSGEAWVRMLPGRNIPPQYRDLFPGPIAPYVIRAMSMVPEGVRWLKELSSAHYLSPDKAEMMDFSRGIRPLSRAQTELIAGRVSALNECFY